MPQVKSTAVAMLERVLRVIRGPVKHALRPFQRPLMKLRGRLPWRVDAYIARAAGVSQPKRHVPPPVELVDKARADRPPAPVGTIRLYVAPANFAGQGRLWARAAEKHLPALGAVNMAVDIPGGFSIAADYVVPREVYRSAHDWQREQYEYVKNGFTHVLIESERTLFGALFHNNAFTEARVLSGHGLKVATIAHGRDIRLPSQHRATYPWSPYDPDEWDEVETLERQVRRNLAGLASLDLPAFVSTPDLLDDLPDATWCPVVIDPDLWRSDQPPMTRPVPVVVHAPTNAKFKGSEQIDPVMQALHDDGLVEYRRIRNVPSKEMPNVIRSADIVLEQFRLGSYGVTACEGMAAGRVVLGHVAEHNRDRVHKAAGEDLPIVETTVESVREVILGLLDDRDRARAIAARGPQYVRALHDGTFSARVLSSFLS